MDGVIQKKYFIGKSKHGIWSSVYTYKPSSLEVRKLRGEIFAVICLQGPKDYDLPTVGNMLLDKFHETYFENKNDSCLLALEKANIELGRYLQKFLENDKAGDVGIDINFISMVVIKDLIYVVKLGGGKFMIYRHHELTDASELLRDPTMEGLIKEASLISQDNDVFFLGTNALTDELIKEELQEIAQNFNEQSLRNRLYKDESKIALIMVGLNIDRNQPELIDEVAKKEEDIGGKEEQTLGDLIEEENKQDTIIFEPNNVVESNEELPEAVMPEEVTPEEVTPEEVTPEEVIPQEVIPQEVKQETEGIQYPQEQETHVNNENKLKKNIFNFNLIKIKVWSFGKTIGNKIKGVFNRQKRFTPQSNILDKKEVPETILFPPQKTETQDLKTYQVILIKIKNGFIELLRGIKKLVWNNWLGFGNNDIYLKSSVARQRKWGLLVVLVCVVLALLYFSVQGLIESQNQKKALELAQLHLDNAEKIISEVNFQADILAKATGSSERKNAEIQKLQNAQNELELARTAEKLADDIIAQEKIIQSIKDKFEKIILLTSLDYIVDFAGKFPNANVVDLVGRNKVLYVIDNKYGKLYSLDYSGTITEIVDGLIEPRGLTMDDKGNLIVLDSETDKSIVFINPQSKSINRMSATSNSKLSGVSQIEFYVLSNKESRIYLLNNVEKSIQYYSRIGSSYSTLINRNTIEEITTAKDFQLFDGRIYLLMQKNMGLYRDYDKREDVINLVGLKENDNILSATAIFIDGTYIYVGDPVNKRILVFLKGTPDITFVAQYVYRGEDQEVFSDIKEIYADKDNGKIFVLTNSKIISLNLESINNFIL